MPYLITGGVHRYIPGSWSLGLQEALMRTFKALAIWTSERQVMGPAPSGMKHDQTPGPLLVAGMVFNMFLPEPLPHYYSRYMHCIALWAISMIFNGQWDSILIILTIGKIREGESYDFACSKVERDPLRCPNISEKGRVMSSQFRRFFCVRFGSSPLEFRWMGLSEWSP